MRDLTLPLRQNRFGSGELLWGPGVHGKVTTIYFRKKLSAISGAGVVI